MPHPSLSRVDRSSSRVDTSTSRLDRGSLRSLRAACALWLAWSLVPAAARADAPPSTELAAVEEALARHPDDVLLLLTRAELLLETAQPALALEDLALVAALAPGDARLPVIRAAALTALGRDDDALADLDRARLEGRASARALVARARLLARGGRLPEAVAAWDELLAQHADVEGFSERSALLARLGRAEDALASDREGLERTGATALRLAVIERAAALGHHDAALDALAPLLAPRAGHGRGRWLVRAADILAAAGRAHEARDRYDEAARELRASAARRPSAAVLTDLSRALLGLGRLDEAELEARRALAASPSVERTDLLTAITRARAIESARPAQGGAR